MRTEKLYILDSTVFLETPAPFLENKPCVTVFEVAEEMRSGKASIEFDKMQRLGLAIIEPGEASIKRVEDIVKGTNDKLSKTDRRVVALAIHFKEKDKNPVVVSDDYAVQNLCKHMKIETLPISKKGIKHKFTWHKRCMACKKIVETTEDTCPVCGSPVKYVPRH